MRTGREYHADIPVSYSTPFFHFFIFSWFYWIFLGVAQCPGGADEYCPFGCGTPSNKPLLSTRAGQKIVGGIEVGIPIDFEGVLMVCSTNIPTSFKAKPHTWPWQISLQLFGYHECGGSVVRLLTYYVKFKWNDFGNNCRFPNIFRLPEKLKQFLITKA